MSSLPSSRVASPVRPRPVASHVSGRPRSSTATLDATAHYSLLGSVPATSPTSPSGPRGLDSDEAQESEDPLQILMVEVARLRREATSTQGLLTQICGHLAQLQTSPAPFSAPPSAPIVSSKLSLVQAFHSCLNGTPGKLPSIARHTDNGSRILTLEPGIRDHAIRFRVCKQVAKCLGEAKYGRARGGLQLAPLLLVSRPERLDPSVTQAPEVHLPIGDGQHLSMAIVESKSDGKDLPKTFPLTGLLDLSRRTEAFAAALAFLYPGAATASEDRSFTTPPGLLLPQALAAVAYALQRATLEVGDLHVEFATYLAADIEAGIDRYLSEVAPVAHLVLDNPTLVFVNSVPSCMHFDDLLEDLRSPVKLHHQTRQWALRSLPAPPSSTPKAPFGAPAPGTPLPGAPAPPLVAASLWASRPPTCLSTSLTRTSRPSASST